MRSSAWPGLTVRLVVNGNHLRELEDESTNTDDPATITRFVEAVSGTNFAVDLHVERFFAHKTDDLSFRVFLDGVRADTVIFENSQFPGPISYKIQGVRSIIGGGQGVLNKFAFAELRTNDETPQNNSKGTFSQLGEVRVDVCRVEVVGIAPSRDRSWINGLHTLDGGVPEKALKGRAVSNHTTLGKDEPFPAPLCMDVRWPWGKEPLATFTFKYRSHRDLQIEGIIPRSPSPAPLEDRDPESLTVEEARELVRRQREQLRGVDKVKVQVKEEKRNYAALVDGDDDDGGDEDISIVRSQERRRKRYRTFNESGVEVVDLCNDDDDDNEDDETE